jgi:hypothetical protein
MRAISAGERPGDDVIDRLVLLVDRAVPEWRRAPRRRSTSRRSASGSGSRAASSRSRCDWRRSTRASRRQACSPAATSPHDHGGGAEHHDPLHVLLQWDDEGNDRQMALDLFDAFASPEKTLHANMGGHTASPHSRVRMPRGSSPATSARRRTRDDRDGMPGAHRRLASSDRFGVRPPR